MQAMPADSVDAVVCDPPAGISFMSKSWDTDHGGRDQFVAWLTERLTEATRLLKPGGHALIWAMPRTSGWTHRAIEDAGLIPRDCIVHLFGSGFPKSRNIGKDIDRMAGATREVIGTKASNRPNVVGLTPGNSMGGGAYTERLETAPATPEAQQWDGWGTALKPASEHWWLARKPLGGASEVLLTLEDIDEWATRRCGRA
jgi:site-specific DNA-methyltransferase (adenine-specific)